MSQEKDYAVFIYRDGIFSGIASGLGRNAGTGDYLHTKRTAQHYAREMNKRGGLFTYKAETANYKP